MRKRNMQGKGMYIIYGKAAEYGTGKRNKENG